MWRTFCEWLISWILILSNLRKGTEMSMNEGQRRDPVGNAGVLTTQGRASVFIRT